jgi:Dolichyl-phosphate-mannose-protein mannosyltransferase
MARAFRMLLVFITLLALGLRLYRLDAQSLWLDEAIAWRDSQAPWPDMVETMLATDCNPPLYFAVLKIWTAFLGDSAVAMRLLSVLFGTLTVPLLGWFVGRRAGAGAGCLAALLLAIAPIHIDYSQEARPYTLFPLLILAATAALLWAFGKAGHGYKEIESHLLIRRSSWPGLSASTERGMRNEELRTGSFSRFLRRLAVFVCCLYGVLEMVYCFTNYYTPFFLFFTLAAAATVSWSLVPHSSFSLAEHAKEERASRMTPIYRHGIYAFLAVLACYTHYFTAFFLAGHGVFIALVCLKERSFRPLRNWALTMIIVGLCYLPWLPFMLRTNMQTVQWLQDHLRQWTPLEQLWITGKALIFGKTYPLPWGDRIPDAILMLAPLAVWFGYRQDDEVTVAGGQWPLTALTLFGVMTVAPFFASWLFSQFRPSLLPRYVIPAVPFAMGVMAMGIWRLRWMALRVVVAGCLVVYLLMCLRGQWADPSRPEMRQAASYVAEQMKPGDGLVIQPWPENLVLKYYLRADMLPVVNDYGWPAEPDEPTLAAALAPFKRVWYVCVCLERPSAIEKYVAGRYQMELAKDFFLVPNVKVHVKVYTANP